MCTAGLSALLHDRFATNLLLKQLHNLGLPTNMLQDKRQNSHDICSTPVLFHVAVFETSEACLLAACPVSSVVEPGGGPHQQESEHSRQMLQMYSDRLLHQHIWCNVAAAFPIVCHILPSKHSGLLSQFTELIMLSQTLYCVRIY